MPPVRYGLTEARQRDLRVCFLEYGLLGERLLENRGGLGGGHSLDTENTEIQGPLMTSSADPGCGVLDIFK